MAKSNSSRTAKVERYVLYVLALVVASTQAGLHGIPLSDRHDSGGSGAATVSGRTASQ